MADWSLSPKVPWDSRWRKIPYFDHYYINQYGQVFNLTHGRLLKQSLNTKKELVVHLYLKAAYNSRTVTRSVKKLLKEVHGITIISTKELS